MEAIDRVARVELELPRMAMYDIAGETEPDDDGGYDWDASNEAFRQLIAKHLGNIYPEAEIVVRLHPKASARDKRTLVFTRRDGATEEDKLHDGFLVADLIVWQQEMMEQWLVSKGAGE